MMTYLTKLIEAPKLAQQFRLAAFVELVAPMRFPFPWPREWLKNGRII